MALFDRATIEIPCPHCGRTHRKTIGWIKANSLAKCQCGARIAYDPRQLSRTLGMTERSVDDLRRTLEQLVKKPIKVSL